MAVSIVNTVSTSASAAGTTGITITKPGSLQDGDVMYAYVSRTDFANNALWTCSGWTQIGPTAANSGLTTGNDRELTILRKVVTNAAGEPSNYTFVNTQATTYQICGTIIALRGVNTATPEDITVPAYSFTTNDATPALVSSTSSTANAFAIAYHQISLGTTATKTAGAPSTWTLVTNGNVSETTGSVDNQHFLASKTLGAAGSTTGTAAWTHTADDATSESLTVVVLVRAAVTTEVSAASAPWDALTGTAQAGSLVAANPSALIMSRTARRRALI